MFVSRRAVHSATRLTGRGLAPLARYCYSTEAATTTTTTTSSAEPKAPVTKPAAAAYKPSAAVAKSTTVAAGASKPEYVARRAENWPSSTDQTPIDWSISYYGASTQPVTPEQFDILMRPVDNGDIEVKPDGVVYLPEIKYRRRLNEAFGPMGWSLIPRGEAAVGESIVTREYALIINGRFVSQAQGENNYFSADQLPSAVEGCKSNALMRCCKDLGIASELWDPNYVQWFKKQHMQEVWVEHQVTKKKRAMWFRKGQVEVPYPWKIPPRK